MKIFSTKKKDKSEDITVQTSPSQTNSHPFSMLDRYVPLCDAQLSLYSSLREAVPVIDAAISKIVRLVGDFRVECRDIKSQKQLCDFMRNVKVNSCSNGINQFIYSYFDQLLTYGTAVGEMVMSNDSHTIKALYNASLEDIELSYDKSPLDVVVCSRDLSGECKAAPYQQLLCLSLLNPQPGTIKGTSLLKGLPFVSSILLKIFNTIGTNWERVGNVRFAVTYKSPQNGVSANSKQRINEIATQWSKAMRDKSQVCDFISIGDVSIKAIGADNQILDCEVPVKQILEQIVSKLSIPPFLLGFSWSSTERMSTQQADILTSELEYYRTLLNPVISKICSMFLHLEGLDDEFEIVWDNISLQDETELASARLSNAQALKIETEIAEVKN